MQANRVRSGRYRYSGQIDEEVHVIVVRGAYYLATRATPNGQIERPFSSAEEAMAWANAQPWGPVTWEPTPAANLVDAEHFLLGPPTLQIEEVVWRLANLASWPLQERYVLNGTKDEYLLASDIIEDVYSLRARIAHPANSDVLGPRQRSAVEHVLAIIGDTDLDYENIRDDPDWVRLRLAASTALEHFGVNVDELSVSEVEQLGG